MVTGKKRLESPRLAWSRKLRMRVRKVSASREPAAVRDGEAELAFFVALAVEGLEGGVVGLGELDEGAGGGEQRRRLVEAAVEGAGDPVEAGDLEGDAGAWGDGRFRRGWRGTGWRGGRR